MVIEAHAHASTPFWIREGLAIYLSDPERIKPVFTNIEALAARVQSAKTEQQMRAVYRDCGSAVADLVSKLGMKAVLDGVRDGTLVRARQ